MKYFVAGGAGFVGSHLAKTIYDRQADSSVVIYDNFSSGRQEYIESFAHDERVDVIRNDITDLDALKAAMRGCDVVYHFASNPDIAKAMVQPDIDFWQGTYLTNNILEAMRVNGIKKLIYSSGSGIYGDTGLREVDEDHAPLLPISGYGASKLAGEAMICAYCHMFDMSAAAFRFANIVGDNQTHGVGFDFVRALLRDPRELRILGDGTQSKSYIHVTDAVDAMLLVESILKGFSYYNVATQDYVTVKEIADIAVKTLGLGDVVYRYEGGSRGWKGDVPIVRFNSLKIRKLGWCNKFTSRQALAASITALHEALRK